VLKNSDENDGFKYNCVSKFNLRSHMYFACFISEYHFSDEFLSIYHFCDFNPLLVEKAFFLESGTILRIYSCSVNLFKLKLSI
jgi:hypothetical protein